MRGERVVHGMGHDQLAAILRLDDIFQSLEKIDEEIRARYTLAYRSTNQNFDGTFRKVRIEVVQPGAKVISRSGYYAIPHQEIVPLSPEEINAIFDNRLEDEFATLRRDWEDKMSAPFFGRGAGRASSASDQGDLFS